MMSWVLIYKSTRSNKRLRLLANTDIIKNSLADPAMSESKINEEVYKFFRAIGCASGGECCSIVVKEVVTVPTVVKHRN